MAAPSEEPIKEPMEEPMRETPLELKSEYDATLVGEFISDAREQLEKIEQGALALEKNAGDPRVLHRLFRAFHTFKGNAGFLDLTPVCQLAHLAESLLDHARGHRLRIDCACIEIILKSRDTLRRFVDEIEAQNAGQKPRRPVVIPSAALKAEIAALLGGGQTAPVAVAESNPALSVSSAFEHETAPQAVKVSTAKLDGLIDLTGELLIAQSLVVQNLTADGVSRNTLARNLDQLSRIGKELQRTAMSMRMIPLRATLEKLHRLTRDLASAQKKNVQLVLEGEETEVDRTIVEKLSDPLMHMVRNAVDHAVERPELRAALGKPATATILVRAYHKSGNVIIEVQDDGAGVDRARITEKAISSGLLKPGARLEDKELLALILQPGFSTAETVTEISGRGVGMDVVHKNMVKLRGRIDIRSTPGSGTTFTLQMPLTMAIIDGLILRVGGQRYILPTNSVRESFHPRSCAIMTLPGGGELVQMRQELIPLLRLREHFRLQAPPDRRVLDAGAGLIVVIEADGEKRCLWVDELVGKQEVVIKNLGEVFQTNPMISGGAILGDGCVGLILDAAALVHLEPAAPALKLAI